MGFNYTANAGFDLDQAVVFMPRTTPVPRRALQASSSQNSGIAAQLNVPVPASPGEIGPSLTQAPLDTSQPPIYNVALRLAAAFNAPASNVPPAVVAARQSVLTVAADGGATREQIAIAASGTGAAGTGMSMTLVLDPVTASTNTILYNTLLQGTERGSAGTLPPQSPGPDPLRQGLVIGSAVIVPWILVSCLAQYICWRRRSRKVVPVDSTADDASSIALETALQEEIQKREELAEAVLRAEKQQEQQHHQDRLEAIERLGDVLLQCDGGDTFVPLWTTFKELVHEFRAPLHSYAGSLGQDDPVRSLAAAIAGAACTKGLLTQRQLLQFLQHMREEPGSEEKGSSDPFGRSAGAGGWVEGLNVGGATAVGLPAGASNGSNPSRPDSHEDANGMGQDPARSVEQVSGTDRGHAAASDASGALRAAQAYLQSL